MKDEEGEDVREDIKREDILSLNILYFNFILSSLTLL